MNLYVVVEGEGEQIVYSKWIPLVNPSLTKVNNPAELITNNFIIISGGGFPQYYKVLQNAIDDVNNIENIDRLVFAIDSEDMDYEDKYNEVIQSIAQFKCNKEVFIVIQHFCLEAWALGNRQILRRNTTDPRLREYLNYFDVTKNDPELLPPYPKDYLNRAQYAVRYLHKIINDRYTGLTYSKRNPTLITQNGYFTQIKSRLKDTNHIKSFNAFLDAFST